jgi:hypothetical protein
MQAKCDYCGATCQVSDRVASEAYDKRWRGIGPRGEVYFMHNKPNGEPCLRNAAVVIRNTAALDDAKEVGE